MFMESEHFLGYNLIVQSVITSYADDNTILILDYWCLERHNSSNSNQIWKPNIQCGKILIKTITKIRNGNCNWMSTILLRTKNSTTYLHFGQQQTFNSLHTGNVNMPSSFFIFFPLNLYDSSRTIYTSQPLKVRFLHPRRDHIYIYIYFHL